MAHRRILDASGRWWDVWETRPSIIDRRAGRERRGRPRGVPDRRHREEERIPVPAEFRNGWLAFQSGTEWRQLAPIPDGWATRSDAELLELLARAGASRHSRRER
jgi:hypothetical protein